MVSGESQDAGNWILCYARAFSLPQSMSEIRTGCLIRDPVNAFSIQAASAREPEEEIKQNKWNKEWQLRIMWLWDLSIGPVVETPYSQCSAGGMGSILVPLVGELSSHLSSLSWGAKILHATQHGQKKKKNHVASNRSCIPLRKLNFMSNHVNTEALL